MGQDILAQFDLLAEAGHRLDAAQGGNAERGAGKSHIGHLGVGADHLGCGDTGEDIALYISGTQPVAPGIYH